MGRARVLHYRSNYRYVEVSISTAQHSYIAVCNRVLSQWSRHYMTFELCFRYIDVLFGSALISLARSTLPKNMSIWLTESLPMISDEVVSSTNICKRQLIL